jgi:uncharacterized protein YciI
MLFAILCADRPQSLDLRAATRAEHVAYLETYKSKLVEVGPLLDADGRPCGSLLIVDVEDRAATLEKPSRMPYK